MANGHRLTIFQMNDSHGYLEPHQELFWSGDHAVYKKAGGYSRIASIMDQARSECQCLAFDCGDTIHGTYPAVKTQGQALVPVLNAMGFETMTAHWDFAYGPDRLREIAEQLKHPVLAINCYDRSTGDLAFEPYAIRDAGGLRIGIIGIASNIVDKTMPPSFSKGLSFTLGREELPRYIKEVQKEGADLVLVISHLGFPHDVSLASEVDGIDLILSAHTHNRLYSPAAVNGTIIIQSGSQGSFLGRLDLDVEDGRIVSHRHQLLIVDEEVEPDPDVEELVNNAMDPHRDLLSRQVGRTATDLNRNTILESTMDNLLLQSIISASDARIALSNGWRYGAPVPEGPVTMNDLYNMVPADPVISSVNLTGREIWRMMEENLEHTFSRDPYNQMGGYVKRCLGVNIYFKAENPPGSRIQEFFISGRRLVPDEVYKAAFITTQAVPAGYGSDRSDIGIRAVEAMKRYLERHDPARSDLRGSVVAV